MKLTLRTDYALRTLMYLGMQPERMASIREIAAAYGISENHMVKVVHELGRGGFIETVRGKGGGIRLGRPAESIHIGDVVRWMEEDMALVACFASNGAADAATGRHAAVPCVLENACSLQYLLQRALAAFLEVLDTHTLADLLHTTHGAATGKRQATEVLLQRLQIAPVRAGQK